MARTYVNHDLRCVDGQTIYLPKWKGGEDSVDRGLTIPDVYVLDTVQKYPVGTKFVDGDRVFHYGYIYSLGAEMTANRGMGGMLNVASYKTTTIDAAEEAGVGETEITIEDTASTVNQWAGGYLMKRAHPVCYYRILSNTVQDGEHSVVTLERGLIVAIAANGTVWLNQNPYSKLESALPNASQPYASTMGICLPVAVAGRWVWLQTWGPCYLTGGDELLGTATDVREAFVYQDGTLQSPAAFHRKQRAGYAINLTAESTSTWYIYLQLAC